MNTIASIQCSVRRISVMILCALSLVLASAPTSAQPCTPDCQPNWNGPFQVNVFLTSVNCPGCAITITYYFRSACNVFNDYSITRIDLSNPCAGCTSQEIFEAAFQALLRLNPAGFGPAPGTCATNWRITQSSCWNRWWLIIPEQPPIEILTPCSGSACCLASYRVCKNLAGVVTTITFTGVSSGGNCATAVPVFGTGPCFTTCSFTNINYGKQSGNEQGDTWRPNGSQQVSAVLAPAPANDIVTITLTAPVDGSARIVVYDLQGRNVLEKEVSMNTGDNSIPLNVSTLGNGVYQYRILVNGVDLFGDKLIIAR